MNQAEAESVKDLAKDTVEAIKILHRAKQEAENEELQYPLNIDEWKWEPKVGQCFIGPEEVPTVIAGIVDIPLVFGTENRRLKYLSMLKIREIFVKDAIPILHWEEIERILEGVGYWLQIGRPHAGGLAKTQCMINKGDEANSRVCVRGKSRQEAVCKAVIALGKEIDAKGK